jgi:hypothetical protein
MHITVKPQGRGLYAAYIGDDLLCDRTHMPFYSAARVLKAWGFPDNDALTMSHEGSNTISLRSTVGKAAGKTISERDKGGLYVQRFTHNPLYPVKHGDSLSLQALRTAA